MQITPLILAIRSISAEFAQRIYLPVVITIGVLLLVSLGLTIWLVTLTDLGWILLVLLVIFMMLFIAAATIAGLALSLLKPRQTNTQREQVRSFVDTLQKSSETIYTPKFIILFRLVKDVIFPSKKSFVKEIATNATSLRNGLEEIIASFR